MSRPEKVNPLAWHSVSKIANPFPWKSCKILATSCRKALRRTICEMLQQWKGGENVPPKNPLVSSITKGPYWREDGKCALP